MATLSILTFNHEGRPIQFDTSLDDLQLYLLCDSRDSVSLFDHTSGASLAPPDTADSATCSQWLTHDVASLSPEDLITHLRTSDTRYRAALKAEFLDKNPPPTYINLYFIVSRLPKSLRVVRDHFLALDPTDLTFDLLKKHLLAAKTSIVAVGAACGTPCTPLFEGCSPSPLAPSYASSTAVDIISTQEVGAASAPSRKRRSGKGKGGRSGGGGSGGGGGGGSGGGRGGGGVGGSGGGSGGIGGGGGGCGGSGGGGGGSSGSGGGGSGGSRGGAVQRGGDRAGQTCGKFHTQHRCFSCLDDAWRAEFGNEAKRPCWQELLRSGVDIFALDYDAILAAMYTLTVSAKGDCYLCVLPDPGIEAGALGASESALPSTTPAEALHTFTLDSSASRCFFRDSTTLTPVPALVPVRLANPSRGPVLERPTTTLSCPADAMVTTTTPGGQRVSICSCTRTGHHLDTFTRRPGSSLYTLTTEPPQVATSGQVSVSGQVAAPCSCRLLSHQTLLWHNRLGQPSVPHLRGMHSRLLVSGLTRSLPPLPPSPAPPFLPCVEGQQRAAPHSSISPNVCSPVDSPHGLRLQLHERFRADLPVLRLHSDRGGEFSFDLLRDFCRGEGILQSFTLRNSPQKNGVSERRIGLVMEVARTSMIHAVAPHFLWPFAGPAPSGVSQVDPLPLAEPVEVTVDSGASRSTASRGAEPASAEPGAASGQIAAPCSCRLLAHPSVLWHHRLGHMSLLRLCSMASQGLVSGLPHMLELLPRSPAPPCTPCIEGQLRTTPHSSSLRPATAPFQTFHFDVWGPAPRHGPERESFFLVVADDYSRYTTVFPLAKKSEGTSMLCRWLFANEATCGSRVVCLHSYRGGCLALVHDTSAGKLSARAIPCVFLGFLVDVPDYMFYHPSLHRFLDSRDIEFVKSVSYFVRYPSRGLPVPPPPLFLAPAPPPAPAPPVPPPPVLPRQVAVDSGGVYPSGARVGGTWAEGTDTGGASSKGAGSEGAGAEGAGAKGTSTGGASSGGVGDSTTGTGGASFGGAGVGGTSAGGTRSDGLRTLGLPSASSDHSPPPLAPDLPPPESSPAVVSPPRPLPAPPIVPHSRVRPCPLRARSSSPVDDLRTALLCSSRRRSPPTSILLSPPGSSLPVSSTPISDNHHTFCPVVSRVLASLVTAPRASPPSVSAHTAAVADFASTRRLDYATRVVAAHTLCAGADTVALAEVKSKLQKRHTCTDLGELRHYLGLQITRERAALTITLTQSHMVQQVLQRFGIQHSTTQPTPLAVDHRLTDPFPDEPFESSGPYAELLGCLIHRPVHWTVTVRVVKYLATTSGMGLVLGGSEPVVLTRHCDSSYADDVQTQRSTKGYCFSLGSGAVSWRSTWSSTVAQSSAEAEIYADAMARRGQARLDFVASAANTADIFTKALPPSDHHWFCLQLGLVEVGPQLL
ncbi:unnamed protein product [Closterium sp. NIES-54]